MLFRRGVIGVLSCVCCFAAIADDECPIGYTREEYQIQTQNLFADKQPIDLCGYTKSYDKPENVSTFVLSFKAELISGDEPTGLLIGSQVITWRGSGIRYVTKPFTTGFRFYSGTTVNDAVTRTIRFSEIQMEEGTVATPYVPYGTIGSAVVGECSPCPPNSYKDYVGNETCTPCPTGMLSQSGSTSEADCMRILHIGDKIYPLNSVKKTSPALHIRDANGKVWYGNLYSAER